MFEGDPYHARWLGASGPAGDAGIFNCGTCSLARFLGREKGVNKTVPLVA